MLKSNLQQTIPGEPLFTEIDKSGRVFRKVTWRIMPFIFLILILAYVDRFNVGYAKLQFAADIGLSNTMYGMGAGLFFIGYLLAELPSNLILARIGARATISRIMVLWGVISTLTMFISTPTQFYISRLLLGITEGGLFPGILLYFTYWFPENLRAKITGIFLTPIPVAGIIGAPLSGYLLESMHGVKGLNGWQWMFLIEGIPSIICGICAYFFLKNSPEEANWLTAEEKQIIARALAADARKSLANERHLSTRDMLTSPIFFVFLALALIGSGIALTIFSFWLPQMIYDLGVTNLRQNGTLIVIPYTCAVVGMIIFGYSSDRSCERRWHYATAALLGALGLIITCLSRSHLPLAIAGLSLAYTGILSCVSVYWAYTTSYLKNNAAVIGLAVLNSIAGMVAYLSLFAFGALRTATKSTTAGLAYIAIFLLIAAVLVLFLPKSLGSKREI